MKRKFINKIVAGIIVSATIGTLSPIKASAEWISDYQGNWYFQQGNQKITGWNKIDGKLYYFDENGKMLTGWTKAGSTWYYLDNNGVLKTGWINYNKNWYYADSSGSIQSGVVNIGGKVYAFDNNGVMKTTNTVINGEFYTIGSDGQVVGAKVPTPDKELDASGNLIQYIKNSDKTVTNSPVSSQLNNVITDQSESDGDPNEGRIFKVSFRDSNGSVLENKSVKYNKSIDLYEPTKAGYKFAGWNTKNDGSGKSYDSSDDIKVKQDISLYAQWSEDTSTYVTDITIKGSSNVAINKTVQMTAEVSPSDASKKSVKWSVTNGTGKATIDSNGVLTGVSTGTITVKAASTDGSNVSSTKEVNVTATEVLTPVTKITVTSKTGATGITASGGTLQMVASVLPDDASSQGITWSVENKTGSANIDASTGLVTAISNGTVIIKATANDGSGVAGSTTITISGQSTIIPIDSITITGKNSISSDVSTITQDGGTLQMIANILPTTASNKAIEWSIIAGQDKATISSAGLLTAKADGTVTVQAKTKDGTGKVVTKDIAISGQMIKVTAISVGTTTGSAATITSSGGTLQMAAAITPSNASNQGIVWSVVNESGSAEIDTNGLLKAKSNGNVLVKATAKDGSGVVGTKEVVISGQTGNVDIQSISVAGKDGVTSIDTDDGTLQMIATVSPSYATTSSPAVTWSVKNGTGVAEIDANGVLKAVKTGSVTVVATSNDSKKITGSTVIYLSNQIFQVTKVNVSYAGKDSGAPAQVVVDGTLQMSASAEPDNASDKGVTWDVVYIPGQSTGNAQINASGVLKGVSTGDVYVVATSTDKYAKASDPFKVTVIGKVPITGITVKGIDSTGAEADTIIKAGQTLQMSADILPITATNKNLTWSVEQAGDSGTTMTGKASISANGVLTPISNGTVKVIATAQDGSKIVGNKIITISQPKFTIKSTDLNGLETSEISVINGTINLSAAIDPSGATTPTAVTWSVEKAGDQGTTMTGNASIVSSSSASAVLKGLANGTVRVKVAAGDGSVIMGTKDITINGITNVEILGASTINPGGTLQLSAKITPTSLASRGVTWSVKDYNSTQSTYSAIDSSGKLTAIAAGTVEVTATANDGSGKSATAYITIK